MIFQVVIIGGGPVAMFCAFMLGVLGFKRVCIVEASDRLGGKCAHLYPEKNVYDIAGIPKIKASELVEGLEAQMNAFPPEVFLNTRALSISRGEKGFVISTNNSEIRGERVIICCGKGMIKPRRPVTIDGFEDAEKAGFVKYSLKDVEMFRDKDIIVGGGGDSALDWCFALNRIARSVCLVHRSALRAHQSSQDQLDSMISDSRCAVFMPAAIDKIELCEDGARMSITIEDTQKWLQFHYFIPCYGAESTHESRISLVDGLAVETEDGGIISRDSRTGEPGIYYVQSSHLMVVGFALAAQAAQAASDDAHGIRHVPHSSSNPAFK